MRSYHTATSRFSVSNLCHAYRFTVTYIQCTYVVLYYRISLDTGIPSVMQILTGCVCVWLQCVIYITSLTLCQGLFYRTAQIFLQGMNEVSVFSMTARLGSGGIKPYQSRVSGMVVCFRFIWCKSTVRWDAWSYLLSVVCFTCRCDMVCVCVVCVCM